MSVIIFKRKRLCVSINATFSPIRKHNLTVNTKIGSRYSIN